MSKAKSCHCTWLQTRVMLNPIGVAPFLRMRRRFARADLEFIVECLTELNFNQDVAGEWIAQNAVHGVGGSSSVDAVDEAVATRLSLDGGTAPGAIVGQTPRQKPWRAQSFRGLDRFRGLAEAAV